MKSGTGPVCMVLVLALVGGCAYVAPKEAAIDHYVQGKMLADQGDLEQALVELAKAVKANPSLAIAHATTGDIHRRQGNYEQAVDSYEKSCQANPYAFRPQYHLGLSYQKLAHRLLECFRSRCIPSAAFDVAAARRIQVRFDGL